MAAVLFGVSAPQRLNVSTALGAFLLAILASCGPADEFAGVKAGHDLLTLLRADSLVARSPHFSGRVAIAASDTAALSKMLDGVGVKLMGLVRAGTYTRTYQGGIYLRADSTVPSATLEPVVRLLGRRGAVDVVCGSAVQCREMAAFARQPGACPQCVVRLP